MKIVLIGSGNVATVLGTKIQNAGHDILQIYARNETTGKKLAEKLQTTWTDDPGKLNENAELYLIAVADSAISEIASALRLPQKLWVHTAGSVSMHVFKKNADQYGVLYPLQSLNANTTYIPEIPFIVSGSSAEALERIAVFATGLSDQVTKATDEQRQNMHIAAIFVNNFSNYLYTITEKFCRLQNIRFEILLPLIRETTLRLKGKSPELLQTGPAMRNDAETIEKHLSLLKDQPVLKEWYRLFSEKIIEHYSGKN